MSRCATLACVAALTSAAPVTLVAQDGDSTSRTTIGGYGEVHYTNLSGADTPGEVNVKRFVVYLAHQFSDRIALRSELEVEDAKVEGGSDGGEVALEQAYLDYRLSDGLSLRAGLMLAPIGIINELHEPPSFNGVERPSFDRQVIPTTWREVGVGIAGPITAVSGLSYRVFLMNGLRADGFSGANGIRGGRQEGKEASFANPSFTGRLEYGAPGLKLGGAFWYGGTAGQDSALGTGTFDVPVFLLAGDARYDRGPLSLRGVVARIAVSNADRINSALGTDVGSRIEGGYLEAAYNILAPLAPASAQRVNLFLRHERFDTHAAVPAGLTRDPSLARRITTMGLSYKPVWNVVFKADYQLRRNRAGTGEDEAASLGIGYQF